jgi:hypothetical protein
MSGLIPVWLVVGSCVLTGVDRINSTSPATLGYSFRLGKIIPQATKQQVKAVRLGMRRREVEKILGEEEWGKSRRGIPGLWRTTRHYPSLIVTYGPNGRAIQIEMPHQSSNRS